jgi:hypothetical protein
MSSLFTPHEQNALEWKGWRGVARLAEWETETEPGRYRWATANSTAEQAAPSTERVRLLPLHQLPEALY